MSEMSINRVLTESAAFWQGLATGKEVEPKNIGPAEAAGTIVAAGTLPIWAVPVLLLSTAGCFSGSDASDCTSAPDKGSGGTQPGHEYDDYDVSDPNRPAVEWQIFNIANGEECGGTTEGITVTVDFGGVDGMETAELTTAANGTLTATISHKFIRQLAAPFYAKITGANGKSVTRELYYDFTWKSIEAVPEVKDECYYEPKPRVMADVALSPADLRVGNELTLSIPAEQVWLCDNSPVPVGDVWFTIEDQACTARLATIDGQDHYVGAATLTRAGEKQTAYLHVLDKGRKRENVVAISYDVKYDDCHYGLDPRVTGSIAASPDPMNALFVGDQLELSIPAAALSDCDGNPIGVENVWFLVENQPVDPVVATVGGEDHFVATAPINQSGDGKVFMHVLDPERNSEKIVELSYYAKSISSNPGLPSVTISENLLYSYHLGDPAVEDITCYSDDPDAEFAWTVTRPGPDAHGKIVQQFDGPTIPSYQFDLLRLFDFKCEATTPGGVKNSTHAKVEVYPAEVVPPAISFALPDWEYTGAAVAVNIIGPDPDWTYSVNYGDGTTASGPATSHAYAQSGTYTIRVTATYTADPNMWVYRDQSIKIVAK